MLVPIVALVACEADLTITAGALGLGLRRSHPVVTVLATLGIALAFVAASLCLWALWFVAPACVVGDACTPPIAVAGWFAAGAAAQWAWLATIALVARRLKTANPGARGLRTAE